MYQNKYLNYVRLIIFLSSISLIIWMLSKEYTHVNYGLFVIGGVIFVALGAYFTNGFNLYDKNEDYKLNGHPMDNELIDYKIKATQEINPNYAKAEQLDNNFRFDRENGYPSLNQEHINIDDCTIDGSCIIKKPKFMDEQEIIVEVPSDKLCQHNKAYNPYISKKDIFGSEVSLLEEFELTGTSLQNNNDDLYDYYMKPVDMVDNYPEGSQNLCHNCKVGVCHHGVCHSI